MVRACAAFYIVAVAIGLFLAYERGWWLLAIGAVGVALSLAYTAPPFRLVHRGLGEPVTALGFGPVMTLGAYFVCAQEWSWEALYISLPVALLIALVLYVNQIPDRAGDEAVGKRTLIVRWPESRVISAYEAHGRRRVRAHRLRPAARHHALVDPDRARHDPDGTQGRAGASAPPTASRTR